MTPLPCPLKTEEITVQLIVPSGTRKIFLSAHQNNAIINLKHVYLAEESLRPNEKKEYVLLVAEVEEIPTTNKQPDAQFDQCATIVVSTGEHCPEKPTRKLGPDWVCEKCWQTYVMR